jgi:hypothetical protein
MMSSYRSLSLPFFLPKLLERAKFTLFIYYYINQTRNLFQIDLPLISDHPTKLNKKFRKRSQNIIGREFPLILIVKNIKTFKIVINYLIFIV